MKKMLALWMALVATSCTYSPAPAAELTPMQTAGAWVVAYGQFGGPREWLDMAPEINVVPRAVICARFGQHEQCAARASHWPDGIYVDEALDFSDIYVVTILVHEMVHRLQYLKSGPSKDCAEWMRREIQAYTIQGDVLRGAAREAQGLEQQRLLQKEQNVRSTPRLISCRG